MPDFAIERIDMQPGMLEQVRTALPDNDPYRSIIEEHRLELRAHHHPITFMAMKDGAPIAYALVCQLAHKPEAVLDIVVPPEPNEEAITRALLEHVLDETIVPISWWTRTPRLLDSEAIAADYGGQPHRKVLRMERSIDERIVTSLETHGFTDEEATEIVRINNEAFAGHPDRAHLTEDDVHEKLRVLGNRYEDLRVTEGGFCWTKRHTAAESELFVLAIDNAHRHHGLGEQLLLATLEYIRTNHRVKRASLYVEHDNTRAITLYERNDFRESGESLHSMLIPAR